MAVAAQDGASWTCRLKSAGQQDFGNGFVYKGYWAVSASLWCKPVTTYEEGRLWRKAASARRYTVTEDRTRSCPSGSPG